MSSLRDRLRRQLGEPAAQDSVEAAPGEAIEEDVDGTAPPADEVEERPATGPRSLRSQLQRLHRTQQRAQQARQAETQESRARHFEEQRERIRRTDPNRPVTPVPPLTLAETTNGVGTYLHGELHLPAEHRHGGIDLGAILALGGSGAVLLSGDGALGDFDPVRALFFDLETTGLMGGSGNLAFLSGFATVDEGGSVRLRQFMLRAPDDEKAALTEIAELLASREFLVSFNGKSFDRNVLADRFTMNRMAPDRVLEMPHLDLLHPARRLFRGTLESCSMSVLEGQRLGVHRDEGEEVRGEEVPLRWFQYLRTADRGLLHPVQQHNTMDVLSLVTLASHLDRCVRAPGAAIPEPRALIAAARLLLERGEAERGEEVLGLVCRGDAGDPVVYGGLAIWAEHHRKQGRHDRAVQLWRRMRAAAGTADLLPWRREAIALEWHLQQHEGALEIVEGWLSASEPDPVLRPEHEAMERRRQRLRRKLGTE